MNASRFKAWLAVIGFVAFTTTPVAASVLYAEGADLGDKFSDATALGPLQIGVNTISGSLDALCVDVGGQCSNTPKGDSNDWFSFFVGDDLKIVAATVTISDFYRAGSGQAGGSAYSFEKFHPVTFGDSVAGVNILTENDVSGLVTFNFDAYFPTTLAEMSYSYVVTLVTEVRIEDPQEIPIPGTLPLSLTALGLVWLRARRNRRSL